MKISVTDEEAKLIRHLASIYDKGGKTLGVGSIPIPDGKDDRWRDQTLARFVNYGIIRYDSTDSVRINSFVLDMLYKIDNPPLPDYWTNLKKWFVASKWRVAIVAFVVILPLIVQWIEMIKKVLNWVGVLDE